MKPVFRFSVLVFILAAGCSAAPFGRTPVPTARPLTATPTASATTTPTSLPTPTVTPSPSPTPSPTLTLTPTATPTPSPTPEPLIGVVANDFTNVYAGPGTDYPLLAVLKAGFRIEVTGNSGSGAWLVVQLPRGAVGWISSSNLAFSMTDASLPEVPAPPRPALTATNVPAPVVSVSPGALAPDAKYTISVRNFLPHERITLKVVFIPTGNIVFKTVIQTRIDGTQELILSTSPTSKEGAYRLTAAGDDGSYAEAEFYVGQPPEPGSD